MARYIFVTGGVVSSLGKGLTTAAFGALTPLLSVTGGVVLLNEDIFLTTIIGIVLVTFGVLMASGIFERDKQANQKKL